VADNSPPTLASKLLGVSLTFLAAVVALWLALELLARIWFWLLLIAVLVVLGVATVRFIRWRRSRW
jgi:hypothetical protein